MKVHLERFTKSTCTDESLEPSYEAVAALLLRLVHEWSATLCLNREDGDLLFLSASNGRYAVMRQQGEEFYDLVGDSRQEGRVEFVHGGQPALHPNRFVVPLSVVLAAAKEFFEGTDSLVWERQGEYERP